MTQKTGYWLDLCEAAARETDPKKLLELTEKLIKALDQHAALKRDLQGAGSKGSAPSSSSG